MPSSFMRAGEILRKNFRLTSALLAPRFKSSAAASRVRALVLEYWKQPVSVDTAIYSKVASFLSTPPQRALISSSTISPQEERSARISSLGA